MLGTQTFCLIYSIDLSLSSFILFSAVSKLRSLLGDYWFLTMLSSSSISIFFIQQIPLPLAITPEVRAAMLVSLPIKHTSLLEFSSFYVSLCIQISDGF